tara:strand:+ start:26367 stop:27299 length:933 start_codon:yes stop_codon:yes gene_type:complete
MLNVEVVFLGVPVIVKNVFDKVEKVMWLIIMLGLGSINSNAYAASIELAKSNRGTSLSGITIEGRIEKGDYRKFLALTLSTKGVSYIFLASPGGNFLEALKIGNLIRKLKLQVWAPMFKGSHIVRLSDKSNAICASSCFFIYAAGINRTGSILGIHRPYMSEDDYKSMDLTRAGNIHQALANITKEYLKEMSIPSKYFDRIMAVDSSHIEWLKTSEVEAELEGFIPMYQEWFSARCEGINDQEEREYSRILKLIPSGSRLPIKDFPFNKEDREFITYYDNKSSNKVDCEIALLTQEQEKARLEALDMLLN